MALLESFSKLPRNFEKVLKSLKSLPDYGLLPQNFIERRDKLISGGFTTEISNLISGANLPTNFKFDST